MSESISSEPHDSMDDVINVYKKDVDRALLRENLKLTVEERIQKVGAIMRREQDHLRVSQPMTIHQLCCDS